MSMESEERQTCTPENPMPPMAPGIWQHSNVISDGTCYEGCCDRYKCLDCGKTWESEVAQ